MRERRAYVVLVVLSLVLAGAAYLSSVQHANSLQAQLQQQRRAGHAAAQRQDAVTEARLCTTLSRLAALKPPPGDPAANPSRAFEQKLYLTLAELGPDVGCRK